MLKLKLLAFLALVFIVSLSVGTAQAQGVATVVVSQHTELGDILADASGNTLYLFTNDERDVSNCSGGCAGAWPPLTIEGDPIAGEGVNTDRLGTITRDGGSIQVTYNGWPLYYYADDQNPGDANGQDSRDVWYVVSPFGGPIQTNVTVNLSEHPELGTILVDRSGRTQYLFTPDERNKSNCSGGCALFWPPLLTIGEPLVGEGVTTDRLGSITRDDGSTQVTYNGWPLYYFFSDDKPGDANGQDSRDVWYVVSPFGGPIQTNALVKTAEHPKLGTILVDRSGRSLYLFTPDEPNTSNCSGGCALAWPPLMTVSAPQIGEGVFVGLLGTTIREDGSAQVTYNSQPLYYFANDEKPGDANGQNIGNVWFVLTAAGNAVQPVAQASVQEATEAPSVGDTAITVLPQAGLIASLMLLVTGGLLLIRRRAHTRK